MMAEHLVMNAHNTGTCTSYHNGKLTLTDVLEMANHTATDSVKALHTKMMP